MQSWLKAGLLGGLVLSVLTLSNTLIYVLPQAPGAVISCCLSLVFFLVYPAIGVLAAYWLKPPRTLGQGAKAGALAGLAAGLIDGIVSVLWTIVMALLGLSQQYFNELPVESLRLLRQMGMEWLLGPGGMALMSCCGGLIGVVWAVGFGALGGTIFAAIKRD